MEICLEARLNPRLQELATLLRWRNGAEPARRRPSLNLFEKIQRGHEIAAEVGARHRGQHNDAGDAQRHADWSKQMADELGPNFSRAAGFLHEIEGMAPRIAKDGSYMVGTVTMPTYGVDAQPLSELMMDMRNNAEGIRASVENRPIDPSRLQVRPGVLPSPWQAPARARP